MAKQTNNDPLTYFLASSELSEAIEEARNFSANKKNKEKAS